MKILMIIISLLSCAQSTDNRDTKIGTANYYISKHVPKIDVINMYGCQYIDNVTYFNKHVYTHLGNCNNPIHCYNKVTN